MKKQKIFSPLVLFVFLFIIGCSGDGGGKSSSANDDCPGQEVDECGVCGGDNSTCLGCDGVPNSGLVFDQCGVCGGDGTSCVIGCDGVIDSGLVVDECGVCGGDNSTCLGCDGVPNSYLVFDQCGVCGGNGSRCNGSATDWKISDADKAKYFEKFYSRFLALDSSGYPHMVYGGDHLYYSWYNGTAWSSATIDQNRNSGKGVSVLTDPQNKLHVSYYSGSILKYATNSSGSWLTEQIDQLNGTSGNGVYTSIAIDSNQKLHVVYVDAGMSSFVKYATNRSGSWVAQNIADLGSPDGGAPSIAVDSTGIVHVSYSSYTSGKLFYITNKSGLFVSREIFHSGKFSSITTDKNDHVHISYYNFGAGSLDYASDLSGSWQITTIEEPISTGQVNVEKYSSIAIDSQNKTHISYYHSGENSLKYATNKSGTWHIATINNKAEAPKILSTGWRNSIALDDNDHVHIAYTENSGQTLNYTNNKSGSWNETYLDRSESLAWFTSCDIDSQNYLHISYLDMNNYNLKYATNRSGQWENTIVESDGVGWYSSVAVDKAGHAHITYYDIYNGSLKYATNREGAWSHTIVDNRGDTGIFTSVDVDNNGYVHIACYSRTREMLIYTTNKTGSWISVDIDQLWGGYHNTIGGVSDDTNISLSIDSDNSVHIAYLDFDDGNYKNTDVKYATNKTGVWTTKIIDENIERATVIMATNSISLALDNQGAVHLAYFNYEFGKGVIYADNAGGEWKVSSVYKYGTGGDHLSLAVNSHGKANISYFNTNYDKLMYLTNNSGSWVLSNIETEEDRGWFSAMVIGSNDNIYVTYDDATLCDLKIAVLLNTDQD